MNKYVIGIDGGGTKTHAMLANMTGSVLAEATTGPSNIAAIPMDKASNAILEACLSIITSVNTNRSDIAAICIGIAGASYEDRLKQLTDIMAASYPSAQITICADYAVALASGLNQSKMEHGIIVIAGTGSVAYGEDGSGHSHRSGGYGWMIDDAGSGYGIGRAAIAATLYDLDGTGSHTSLTKRLQSYFELPHPTDIISKVYSGKIDLSDIASISKIVTDAVEEDSDEVAKKIQMQAAGSLARFVWSVHKALFSNAITACPIITAGSLWNSGVNFTDVFYRSVRRFAPNAAISPLNDPPAYGSILKAIASLL